MKDPLREYFYYTRTERNGALVLVLLITAFFIIPQFYPLIVRPAELDFTALEEEIAQMGEPFEVLPEEGTAPPELFLFDPNFAGKKELMRLGLPEKTAQTILNYRKKGGRFHKKSDLQKIYGISPKTYQQLESYIVIKRPRSSPSKAVAQKNAVTPAPPLHRFDPNTADREELTGLGLPEKVVNTLLNYRSKGRRFHKKEDLQKIYGLTKADYDRLEPFIDVKPENRAPIIIDINQAAREEWQKLKGIGPYYSRRIVEFRDRLGGFTGIEQVGQTRGLPDSTFQQIRGQLVWSPIFRFIEINRADRESLQAHPYLNQRQANAIVNYRQNHGPFHSKEELLKVKALPAETIEKLVPYLVFE